jgi:hypothetical protein
MKASFIIAVLVAAFTSSAALAARVPTSNNAAIHCTKQKNDAQYIVASGDASAPAAGKSHIAK